MPRKILAPHKEQDGWAYIRISKGLVKGLQPLRVLIGGAADGTWDIPPGYTPENCALGYNDGDPNSRIISSRRVEEAVETADFLKRCAEDELTATRFPRHDDMCWRVDEYGNIAVYGYGTTLRAAYYRYHAAAGDAK